MFPIIITCGSPQREELLRKILGGGFLNFIKQNYTERRKTERKKEFKLTLDHHRASTTERRKKFFFLNNNNNNNNNIYLGGDI